MIRTVLMLGFWAILLPLAALICFPWTLFTGNVNFLYRVGMWGARTGVRLAGVRVQVIGLDKLIPHVHTSSCPITLPTLIRRC